MQAFYDSHFGPVPVKITRVERDGARWHIFATVTRNSPVWANKSLRPIYKRGQKILASEKAIFPKRLVSMTENGNISYTYKYDPAKEYREFLK